MSREISLNVNGKTYHVSVEPDTPLLYVLRNDLKLKGAKFACGLNQCGACRVIIDGQAVTSCRLPVKTVEGREITTIEGLGTIAAPHPLQKAFIEEQAVQCGFCTPGMVVAAKALLDKNPRPTDEEIKAGMSKNLCRCGTHNRIIRAIRRVSDNPAPTRSEKMELHLDPPASPELPKVLENNPDLDSWVCINADGTITLYSGKVELGQDLRTSIAMIGADELDVSFERVQVVMGDTALTPDEGYTTASLSLETSGNAIRYAAAEVRHVALAMAQTLLEVPVENLTVSDGTITDTSSGHSTSYWELLGGQKLNRRLSGNIRPKRPEAYNIVGRPTGRLDLMTKVTGGAIFVHDLDLPDMVHGRIVRPPNYSARLETVDTDAVSRMPGVLKVVRNGSFLGIIAIREEQAVRAMEALQKAATWKAGPGLPNQDALFDYMLDQPDQAFLIDDTGAADDSPPPIQAPENAAKTLSATYYRPYHSHASLGPSAAVAQWIDDELTVWSHNQGSYPLRKALAQALKKSETEIRVIHVDGPGCYGHNGADDAALDAALLAGALPGRPVLLKWTRADENAWEPYGSAMAIKLQASLDKDASVIDWNHDVWSYTHSTRPRDYGDACGLLASWHLAEPFENPRPGPNRISKGGVHRNAYPLYTFPRRRIVKHYLKDGPLRTSALRGLGSYANIFAIESFMDELAHAAEADPVEFRLRYLKDERARAVIEGVMEKAGRQPVGQGRGMAFSRYKNRQCYVAVVVDLTLDLDNGAIQIRRAVIGADVGQIVNPVSLASQLEGALIQSASWTLKEQVTFGPDGITSCDWRNYPVFRFAEVPVIETVLLNRPGQPFLGVGEGAQGPASAAIANAVFDLTGIRPRQVPFTPERIMSLLMDR